MKTSDFDYVLPKKLIAQKALAKRDNARLMVVKKKIKHDYFYNILDYLKKGDVLVLNETKVVKAKLVGKKETGAPAEIIVERHNGDYYECRINSRKPQIGGIIHLKNKLEAKIIGRNGAVFHVQFNKNPDLSKGELPQPTYIKRKITEQEYQTVYAKNKGSVASPTAGLHFTKDILNKARKKGIKIAKITLHIGFGTFLPVLEEDFRKHEIHEEYFEISNESANAINSAEHLVVVGTTSLRALESANYKNKKIQSTKGMSNVYITPGHEFKSRTEILITNFHLPRSTLLLMVSAFAGKKIVLNAYKEAVKKKYRFYSLGDGMILFKENSQPQ